MHFKQIKYNVIKFIIYSKVNNNKNVIKQKLKKKKTK